MNLQRIAFEALYDVEKKRKTCEPDAPTMRNAAMHLAHHLRAHGLSATLGYGLQNKNTQSITKAFVDALHKVCPIPGADAEARVQSLANPEQMPIETYLLHSRLALVLADSFSLTAKSLWPTENAQQEHAHA